jgi:hypothetical protein
MPLMHFEATFVAPIAAWMVAIVTVGHGQGGGVLFGSGVSRNYQKVVPHDRRPEQPAGEGRGAALSRMAD